MAWLGPLAGTDPAPTTTRPVLVRSDTFQDLLADWRPRLRMAVSNRLGGQRETLDILLEFTELRDFRPERVVQAVAPLRSLVAVREVLGKLKDEPLELDSLAERLTAAGADAAWSRNFQDLIAETKTSPSGAGPDPLSRGVPKPPRSADVPSDPRLDGLLDLVDLTGGSSSPRDGGAGAMRPGPGEESFQRLIRILSGASGRHRRMEKEIASEAVLQLDAALGEQLATILHHPDFVELETAWRALKFLVDRTDFRSGVELEVYASSKDDLARCVEETLVPHAEESTAAPPLIAAWLDFEFDATSRDMALLARIGAAGESLQVPFLAAASPEFFGAGGCSAIERMSPLWDAFQEPAYIPFAALRGKPVSAYLALAVPRVLARFAYGRETSPTRGFDWEEGAAESWSRARWTRPVAALASCVARSVADHGWPTDIVGASHGGVISDLPVAQVTLEDERTAVLPLDAAFGESILDELSEAGFCALGTVMNRDVAYVAAAPMLSRISPGDDKSKRAEARREASLPYRMLAAMVAGAVRRVASGLKRSGTAVSVRGAFESGLGAALGIEDRSRLAVAVEKAHEGEAGLVVGIHVRPPAPVLGAEVSMDLAVEVGG